MPRVPSKKIAFQMSARQAYIVLDWLGHAIAATPAQDEAHPSLRLLQSQLKAALRAEIGTPAAQKELFGPSKPNGKSPRTPSKPAKARTRRS